VFTIDEKIRVIPERGEDRRREQFLLYVAPLAWDVSGAAQNAVRATSVFAHSALRAPESVCYRAVGVRWPRMPCGWGCGGALTASEMRTHFSTCRKRRYLHPLQGRTPRIRSFTRYSPVRAVIYKVLPSASPQAQLAGISGNSIVPRCRPSGEMIKRPPGPVA